MTNDEPLTLRDIAQRASDRHNGARGRELDRIAKRAGLTLSYTTVDKILNGTYLSRPKRDTLDALAILSGTARDEVYRAAGEPLPLTSFAEQLPADADLLSAEQRSLVLRIVGQFAELNRELASERAGGEHVRSAPMNRAGVSPAGSDETLISEHQGNVRALDPTRFVQPATGDEEWAAEDEAAHPMPEGGTEYQKRAREQDEAAEGSQDDDS